MASEVYDKKTIKLKNGKEIEIVPLSIRGLREFTGIWEDYLDWMRDVADRSRKKEEGVPSSRDIQKKTFDVYVELTVLSLEKIVPEKELKDYEDLQDFIETELDEKSMLTVLKYAGGLDLNSGDPNQTAGTDRE